MMLKALIWALMPIFAYGEVTFDEVEITVIIEGHRWIIIHDSNCRCTQHAHRMLMWHDPSCDCDQRDVVRN